MVISLLLLAACEQAPAPTPAGEASGLVPLEPALLARRVSLDLRGVVPEVSEIEAVEADPEALDGLVETWMADERYAERLVDVFAEQWLTRVDEFPVSGTDFGLGASDEYSFLRSVGEEPLRLMAHVATEDLPWTEVVTADYTMANDLLVSIWDLAYIDPDLQQEWKPARYGDGRPAAGVVTTNGLWWRYPTTLTNYNRGRAAALAKLLLCFDYSQRPVSFTGITDVSSEALLAATQENENCVVCHASVDALATSLFGFWWFETRDATEMSSYHPEREPLGRLFLGMESTYYGQPLGGVANLGPLLASDSRFLQCSVERAVSSLWHRPLETEDFPALQGFVDTFRESGLRYNALVLALLETEEYRAGAVEEDADDALDERVSTRRLLGPEQLASAVQELTGFRWTWEGYDQIENDTHGYRVMAGGIDGDVVTSMASDPTLTRGLALQRLAQAAAVAVVSADAAAAPAERRLFAPDGADLLAIEPGSADWDAQLRHLHLAVHGVVPDEDTLAAEAQLWTDIRSASDATQAWESLVSVLLRDPAFWSY